MTHQCIYIGTLLSRVAYPHIDIGLIESYPRGTSCRGDTCRSFIKDRQNKSRVKGLLVPYGTIELPQLAPSSTATIFSSTRIHGVPPTCSSSPTLNIKKESRVLRDFKYIKKESTLFHLLDILLIPLSITLKNIYIYIRIQFYFPSSSKISPDEDNPLSRYRHVNISWRTGRFCETTLYRRANGLTKGPVKR